jgi:hypothetical protein
MLSLLRLLVKPGPQRRADRKARKWNSGTTVTRLVVESLEQRCVPTTLHFTPGVGGVATPQFGAEDASHSGGISSHPSAPGDLEGAPIWLIFAEPNGNAGFGYDGSVSVSQITTAVRTILNSPYLSSLQQYVGLLGLGSFFFAGSYASDFNLPPSYSADDINNLVVDAINHGVPEVDYASDTGDSTAIYAVFTPQGYTIGDQSEAGGYHPIGQTGQRVSYA